MATTPSFYLAWGLVTVPIKSYPAARDERIELVNLHPDCNARVKHEPRCTAWQAPVADPVKGYEVGKGAYVLLTKEELKELEAEKTKTMEVKSFVKAGSVDPVYFGPANYLGPADPAAAKAFLLLRRAMEHTGLMALVQYVQGSREKIGMIRVVPEALMLHELFYADEMRTFESQNRVPGPALASSDEEAAVATELVAVAAGPFDLSGYADGYRQRVTELIQARIAGQPAPKLEIKTAPAPVVDLMASLKQSLEAAKKAKKAKKAGKKAEPKKPKTLKPAA